MGLSRKRSAVVQARPRAEIVGVSREEVARGGTGLYEFSTVDGMPVYLHDLTLTSVHWKPVRRWLGFRFEGERDVVIEFDGVVILEWGQNNEGFEPAPVEVAGQVADFSYDGDDGFEIVTARSVIGFTATRVTVGNDR